MKLHISKPIKINGAVSKDIQISEINIAMSRIKEIYWHEKLIFNIYVFIRPQNKGEKQTIL